MAELDWIPPNQGGDSSGAVRVHVTVRMLIPAGKRRAARDTLASMIERIKLEEGCLSCRLYQDALEGNVLMFEEIWADEGHLQRHMRSDEFRTLLLMVEMASRPPEIRFDRVAHSSGIGAIEGVL